MKNLDLSKLKQLLAEGIEGLPIELDQHQQSQLLDYLFLLNKWNAVYNLTAIRDPEKMISQHLLDSLTLVPELNNAHKLLDVGSGGGLPGIVLAIACPHVQVSMVDKVQKKGAFLNQVKAELGLKNVSVYTGAVEALGSDNQFDVITSRAFSDLNTFISLAGHLLEKNGCFIAMKGAIPHEEMQALPGGYKVSSIKPISVPGLNAQRHLVFMSREKENG